MSPLPGPPPDALTLELLARVREGDSDAAGEIYRRHHDELLFFVRARLGTRLRAVLESEDVLQSVALEAVRSLPRFEPRGDGSLRRFLHTLVLNKIRDLADLHSARKRDAGLLRGDSVLARLPAASEPPTYFDGAYLRLERCLAVLPEDMREALVLRRLEGLSSKELADRLGRSEAAARKLYSRALARLSALMRERAAAEDRRA